MKTFKVTVDGHSYTVQVEEISEAGKVDSVKKVESKDIQVSQPQQKSEPAPVKREADSVAARAEAAPQPRAGGSSVKAPMPGSILEVKVNVGDEIKDGDVLLVLEAMKMENELTASQAGKVAEILVKKGDTVNSGDPLIVLS